MKDSPFGEATLRTWSSYETLGQQLENSGVINPAVAEAPKHCVTWSESSESLNRDWQKNFINELRELRSQAHDSGAKP